VLLVKCTRKFCLADKYCNIYNYPHNLRCLYHKRGMCIPLIVERIIKKGGTTLFNVQNKGCIARLKKYKTKD